MVRAGFVYQVNSQTSWPYLDRHADLHHKSASGVFQLLPLGLRVQDKISHIIDRHMRRFGEFDCLPIIAQPLTLISL